MRVMALWPDVGASRRIAEVDVLVEELPQSQVLGQRRRQHQAGVGHQMLVVEGHLKPVESCGKIRASK